MKLAAYFIHDTDGSPVLDPKSAPIRMVGGIPVLGLDSASAIVRAVGDPAERTLEFIGSDETVDRYREVLSVSGWDLKAYRQNPVFQFGHNYKEPPIGRSRKTWKDMTAEAKALRLHIQFMPADISPFADSIYRMYLGGYMNASSVGFLPFEWKDLQPDPSNPNDPWRIYTKQELLELSAVPVPANPSALVNAVQKGVLKEAEANRLHLEYGFPVQREVIDLRWVTPPVRKDEPEEVEITCEVCVKPFKALIAEADVIERCAECAQTRGVVPFSAHGEMEAKFPQGTAWSGPKARKNLAKWATGDGDQVDWKQYGKGFAYFDSANKETMGAYNLPHHDILDGNLAHHWRGSAAAMAALLGSRGGVNLPDTARKGVYNHLVNEYAVFEKEPPDFKEYATPEDILSGAKDGVTAYYLYGEVVGYTPADKLPAAFLEKWPTDLAALTDESEAGKPAPEVTPAPAAEQATKPTKTVVIEAVRDGFGKTCLLLASEVFLEEMAKANGATIKWEPESEHLRGKIIEAAREFAFRMAFDKLPPEQQLIIRDATPENERIDPFKHPLFLAGYLCELIGEAPEKAGAVLNKRNLARVKAILQHAQDILAEAEPPSEKTSANAVEPERTQPPPAEPQPSGDPAPAPDPEQSRGADAPESEAVLEIETPDAPVPGTDPKPVAPPAASEGDVVLEVEAEQLAEAVGEAVQRAIATQTGDVRYVRRGKPKAR